MSCGQHWNTFILKGPAFKRKEGQCVTPSTTCQIQQILQSSQSLHLKARRIEGHNCAQCYHWASWTAAGMHLHYSQTPRKMSHAVFFQYERKIRLFPLLTGGETERTQALCQNLTKRCCNLWAFFLLWKVYHRYVKEWQKWYILSFQGTKSISVKHGLALEKIDVNPVSDIILAAPKLISPAFVSAELACSSLHISHFKREIMTGKWHGKDGIVILRRVAIKTQAGSCTLEQTQMYTFVGQSTPGKLFCRDNWWMNFLVPCNFWVAMTHSRPVLNCE